MKKSGFTDSHRPPAKTKKLKHLLPNLIKQHQYMRIVKPAPTYGSQVFVLNP
jgi:hypothetical protein